MRSPAGWRKALERGGDPGHHDALHRVVQSNPRGGAPIPAPNAHLAPRGLGRRSRWNRRSTRHRHAPASTLRAAVAPRAPRPAGRLSGCERSRVGAAASVRAALHCVRPPIRRQGSARRHPPEHFDEARRRAACSRLAWRRRTADDAIARPDPIRPDPEATARPGGRCPPSTRSALESTVQGRTTARSHLAFASEPLAPEPRVTGCGLDGHRQHVGHGVPTRPGPCPGPGGRSPLRRSTSSRTSSGLTDARRVGADPLNTRALQDILKVHAPTLLPRRPPCTRNPRPLRRLPPPRSPWFSLPASPTPAERRRRLGRAPRRTHLALRRRRAPARPGRRGRRPNGRAHVPGPHAGRARAPRRATAAIPGHPLPAQLWRPQRDLLEARRPIRASMATSALLRTASPGQTGRRPVGPAAIAIPAATEPSASERKKSPTPATSYTPTLG